MKSILITLLSSILLGFIGLFFGSWYGGNIGFFDFLGLRGYEAGGTFCGLIGLILGALIGFFFSRNKN